MIDSTRASLAAIATAVFAAAATAQAPWVIDRQYAIAPDGAVNDWFGNSLDFDGTTLVVSAINDDDRGTDSGSVYVFAEVGGQWTFQQKLLASDGAAGDKFGYALALAGDYLYVGAPLKTVGFPESGQVYVFHRSGGTWSEVNRFDTSVGQQQWGTWFGAALAHDAGILVVGAPKANGLHKAHDGRAYVLATTGANASIDGHLHPSVADSSGNFGHSVSVDSGRIAIGSPFEWKSGGAGVAYTFVKQGQQWNQESRIVPPTITSPTLADCFGSSVSLSGQRLAVGTSNKIVSNQRVGGAYVFFRQGGSWTVEASLEPKALNNLAWFGEHLHLADDSNLVIGAPLHFFPARPTGSVSWYRRSGASWTLRSVIRSNGDPFGSAAFGGASAEFGSSPRLVADKLALGFIGDSPSGQVSGSVPVLQLELGGPKNYCTAKANSCGTLPVISSAGSPSATASDGFVVRASNVRAGKSGLLFFSGTGPAAIPFQGGTLCIASTGLRRTVPVADSTGTPGQCDGVLELDLNTFATGEMNQKPQPLLRTQGATVWCQYWGRDTLAHGSMLSDALQFNVYE